MRNLFSIISRTQAATTAPTMEELLRELAPGNWRAQPVGENGEDRVRYTFEGSEAELVHDTLQAAARCVSREPIVLSVAFTHFPQDPEQNRTTLVLPAENQGQMIKLLRENIGWMKTAFTKRRAQFFATGRAPSHPGLNEV